MTDTMRGECHLEETSRGRDGEFRLGTLIEHKMRGVWIDDMIYKEIVAGRITVEQAWRFPIWGRKRNVFCVALWYQKKEGILLYDNF